MPVKLIRKRGIKTSIMKGNLTIRSASSLEDFSVYRQICEEQDWLLGKHDPELLFAADPTGYYIGELEGQAISTLSAVKYKNHCSNACQVCCFGVFGVLQKFNNKGYGYLINQFVIDDIFKKNKDTCIFLITGEEIMAKKMLGKYNIYRGWPEYELTYEASKATAHLVLPDPWADIKLGPYQKAKFINLFNYDSKVFGYPRRQFLEKLVSLSSCTSFIATTARSREIVGYCTIRETNDDNVCYLSPWYANDAEIAQQLLKKAALFACERNPNVKFRSIMPELNKDGLQIMHRLAPQVKNYKRLFIGKIPDSIKHNLKNKVFAISSPCLG